jgi:hypothetical protein
MSTSGPSDVVGKPNLFFLSSEMTRDERSRTVRAFLDDAEKRNPTFSHDPVDISEIALKASEAVKRGKHITHEQIAESRARLAEAERSNKVLLELQTDQGRITIDHSGISSDSEALLANIRAAFDSKHESGELPKPADKSEYLSQLIDVVKSLYARETDIPKKPELQLSNALGTATLFEDGTVSATGAMAVVIAGLLEPGNSLSAKPTDQLNEIIAQRYVVLQSLFSTTA